MWTTEQNREWVNILAGTQPVHDEQTYECQACMRDFYRHELYAFGEIQACQECIEIGRANDFAIRLK